MSLQQGDQDYTVFDYFVADPSSSRPIPLDVADHDMRKKIVKVKLADARLHELYNDNSYIGIKTLARDFKKGKKIYTAST